MQTLAVATTAPKATAKPTVVKQAHGFTLAREEYIKEYDSYVLMYKHDKTGAELISVLNSDENKTFGVVFRTPVENSYGIPHILEHSVLCGSRKYPIKEPFVELMKGSLNTFLNAFTYPDRTCYPVASTNTQDFYNLVDVYLDAVFFPRCISDPKVFEQEGWHFEMDSPEDNISYKGVVFNEMKGVYSQPDSMFYRTMQQVLFPDNTYRHDSGGDPSRIPELTFQQFQQFHSQYYHPSNAKFWFYGDDEPMKRLKMLDEYLSQFEAKKVLSAVETQRLLPEVRREVHKYAAGESQDGEELKAYTAVNWVLTEQPLSLEDELGLSFLDYLLLGTAASPLRKALNDSGLGQAVVGGGVDDDLKQPVFCVGLKGVEPQNVDKVESLVMTKLAELAKSGFSATAVEAAINTIEFSLRENNTGSFPRGLSLMLRAVGAWIYDQDPYRALKWEEPLAHLKQRLASGEDVFGPLIHKFLLNNTHRVVLTMLPDQQLGQQVEAEEAARLEAKRGSMTPEDIEAVVKSTLELKERQETPDPPEALACVPCLQLSDIPTKVTPIPTDVTKQGGATILTHDLFTNDVLYLEAALDMRVVPAPLLPLVPLFCRSLTQMGTAKESFIELTERIGRKTGGVGVSPFYTSVRGKTEPLAFITVRGKAMSGKTGDLLELMRDVLLTARLDDRERFKQMVLETKAGLESGIVGSGHSFAMKRLSAQRTQAGWLGEVMGGLSYLDFIRGLVKRVESDWDSVKADLESIRQVLLQRNNVYVNMTGDTATLSAASPHVNEFLASLPDKSSPLASWGGSLARVNEALVVPTQVNYVGKAANLYQDAGYELHGSAYVIEKHLGTTWLWDRVRVVGGAYGGFCSFDSHSGQFSYLSYRDPNLLETLETYDGTVDFLRTTELHPEELTKAIIGTIGDIDAYQLPDAKGSTAFTRYLLGISDEERQLRREQVLGTSQKDFRNFADALECVKGKEARVAVVTSADKAAAVNEKTPNFWEIRKVL